MAENPGHLQLVFPLMGRRLAGALLGLLPLLWLVTPPPTRAEFLLPESVPPAKRFQNYDRAFQATVQIERGRNGGCSAQFVSHTGYLLTARHCLEDCLKKHRLGSYSPDRTPLTPRVALSRSELGRLPLECELQVEDESHPALLVALGERALFFEESQGADPADMRALIGAQTDGYGAGANDFAVLKVASPAVPSCVPIARRVPQLGEPIWVVGYPMRTRRKEGGNSDGRSKYVSVGQACAKSEAEEFRLLHDGLALEELNAFVRNSVRRYGGRRSEFVADYGALEEAAPSFASSVDTFGGSSGGGVYNAQGELAGLHIESEVLREGFSKKTRESPWGAARHVSLPLIRQQVAEKMGEAAAREIFDCF